MDHTRLTDAGLALLAGGAGVAGSYAVAGLTPEFVAAPVANTAANLMPGAVVTFAILVLGSLGQKLNLLTAVLASAVGLGLAAGLGMVAARRVEHPAVAPVAGGALAWLGTAVLTGAPLAALGAAAPLGVVLGVAAVTGDHSEATFEGRRSALANVGGVVGFSAVAYVLGTNSTVRRPDEGATGGSTRTPFPTPDSTPAGEDASTPADDSRTPAEEEAPPDDGTDQTPTPSETERKFSLARERALDVEGLEPLVSRGREFYRVDVNAVDPTVNTEDWSLSVTGAVDEELTLDFEALRSRPAREEFVTLRCVGDPLNGKKLDNALWTVTDIMPLLEEAGLPDGSCCLMLRAADDYYEEFPLEAAEDGMLAYRMNGQPLPRGHGAPVRAHIPGHWGEINVKWLTEIEVLNQPAKGYWEKRGWHGTGPVNTVAKLWQTNTLDDGRKQVAGMAYAGTRGVSAVEVSTDGGSTWNEARLSERLPGVDVWRQWAYEYEPPGGKHEVVVRARDGEGTLQSREPTDPFPSGAAGWVSKTITS